MWLTIAQGVAQHIRLNREEVGERLALPKTRARLVVESLTVPSGDNDVKRLTKEMIQLLSEKVAGTAYEQLRCSFSTSDENARIAGDIIFLDSFSPYFDYVMNCICGIPTIMLTGEAADWKNILKMR